MDAIFIFSYISALYRPINTKLGLSKQKHMLTGVTDQNS